MTDETELTEEQVAKIIEEIDALIERLFNVLVGESRDHMVTAFAYLIASNIHSDEDAKELLPNFVEQVCEGWKCMKESRSYQ
jgi:hypothetical protein